MLRSTLLCIALGAAACATSQRVRFDSTPGQLSLAGSPQTRGPDAVWGDASAMEPRTIHFHPGTAVIDRSSYRLLDETAEALGNRPDVKQVVIEGHTDSSGGEQLNATLSRERAEAVRAYLVNKGVDAKRLKAAGFGATHPIASNDNDSGREANRRVEFKLQTSTR